MGLVENRFNEDIREIYSTTKKELGYNATRFVQLVLRPEYESLFTDEERKLCIERLR